MSIFKRILKMSIIIIVLAIAFLGVWQKDNIKAVYTAFTTDSETLANNLQEQTEEHISVLEEYGVDITVPNIQQTDELLSGITSADEVKSQLNFTENNYIKYENILNTTSSNKLNNNTSDDMTETINTIVNDCVSDLYSYRVDVMSELGKLKQEAINEWVSLSPEEQTDVKKRNIGMAGLDKCYDLEDIADSKVKHILETYKNTLKNIGADTSIIDTLWKQYCDEKEAQKSYYINKYMN